MKLPIIHGYIERRILVNFIADPDTVKAIVGICLIRIKNIKPKGFPDFIGISSENGAHRMAVE